MVSTQTRYSTTEVSKASGATYRQLDYWCRRGLIRPTIYNAVGSGNHRAWSVHDVATVKILRAVNGWIPINRLGRLVEFLNDLPLQQWSATSIVLDSDGGVWRTNKDAPKVAIHIDLSLVFDTPGIA